MRRRDMLIALGLAACNTKRPKKGLLGTSERVNEAIESFLLHDVDPSPRDVTPQMAYPSYHVAPAVPMTPSDWVLGVHGNVGAT